jgi:hypothetical protein
MVFYAGGALLEEVRVTHPMATVEVVEAYRLGRLATRGERPGNRPITKRHRPERVRRSIYFGGEFLAGRRGDRYADHDTFRPAATLSAATAARIVEPGRPIGPFMRPL